MPNRVVRKAILRSDRLITCSIPARYTFLALILNVDDFGRAEYQPAALKSDCFPADPQIRLEQFEKWIEELVEAGAVLRYAASGKSYIVLHNWDNTPRARQSKFPDPPGYVPAVRGLRDVPPHGVKPAQGTGANAPSAETVALDQSPDQSDLRAFARICAQMRANAPETETVTELNTQRARPPPTPPGGEADGEGVELPQAVHRELALLVPRHHLHAGRYDDVAQAVADCGEQLVVEALQWARAGGRGIKAALARAKTRAGRQGFESAQEASGDGSTTSGNGSQQARPHGSNGVSEPRRKARRSAADRGEFAEQPIDLPIADLTGSGGGRPGDSDTPF